MALEELFYCAQKCQTIKCLFCVREEIVSTYCQQCLENVSSAEVIPNRGRCAKCYICPVCRSVAKMVTDGAVCMLKCVYCPWSSAALAIAPTSANLIQLLREQERGGPAAVLFKERQTEFGKAVDEAASARAQQDRSMAAKKTKSMLQGTPAKKKYFSLDSALVEEPGRRKERHNVPGPASSSGTQLLDGLARLEVEEETKNKAQFGHRSLLAHPVATADEADGASAQVVERQKLLTSTLKRCGACDSALVKLDVNPSNLLDPKKNNRIHSAAMFVARVGMISMSAKAMKVTLVLSHPIKSAVQVELCPVREGARYTVATQHALTLPNAPAGLPVRHLVNLALGKTEEATSSIRFGVHVTLRYENMYGKQETRYEVKIN